MVRQNGEALQFGEQYVFRIFILVTIWVEEGKRFVGLMVLTRDPAIKCATC